jgi:hypothetical protein
MKAGGKQSLASSLDYSSTLKMKAKYSSEISVDFQRTTGRYNQEDIVLHNDRCENLKTYISQDLT